MFDSFYPKEAVESVYTLDFRRLYEMGFRGVIFDIDNTLVPHGAPADERSKALFAKLRELGIDYLFLSNNKEPRVKPFAQAVMGKYIAKGNKPSRQGYLRAMEKMGTEVSNTLFIGDQLFTDVWGANRTGIYSILVKPINPKEELQIVLKRRLEAIVLYFYRRKQKKEVKER